MRVQEFWYGESEYSQNVLFSLSNLSKVFCNKQTNLNLMILTCPKCPILAQWKQDFFLFSSILRQVSNFPTDVCNTYSVLMLNN